MAVLTAVDALVGGVAAGVSASMSETLSANQAVPLLCLIGLLFWPAAVGISRGYRRTRIGVGFDEFRAVMLRRTSSGCGLRATGWICSPSK